MNQRACSITRRYRAKNNVFHPKPAKTCGWETVDMCVDEAGVGLHAWRLRCVWLDDFTSTYGNEWDINAWQISCIIFISMKCQYCQCHNIPLISKDESCWIIYPHVYSWFLYGIGMDFSGPPWLGSKPLAEISPKAFTALGGERTWRSEIDRTMRRKKDLEKYLMKWW